MGFLYETMSAVEKDVVNRLFASGAIQVSSTTGLGNLHAVWLLALQSSNHVHLGFVIEEYNKEDEGAMNTHRSS